MSSSQRLYKYHSLTLVVFLARRILLASRPRITLAIRRSNAFPTHCIFSRRKRRSGERRSGRSSRRSKSVCRRVSVSPPTPSPIRGTTKKSLVPWLTYTLTGYALPYYANNAWTPSFVFGSPHTKYTIAALKRKITQVLFVAAAAAELTIY